MQKTMTRDEWLAEAERRFGKDTLAWKFKCPVCKVVTSVKEWKDAGAPEGAVAFSCVGRFMPDAKSGFDGKAQPCDYAGGGLFRLNPVKVDDNGAVHEVFEFADAA
jgi:hypothetical protein